ncbi:MAG: SpoIIE family protein phosphatase [Pirellulales bacterium]|nr:SpoIIE family protein phosphatase [Pirellulales bacterium]
MAKSRAKKLRLYPQQPEIVPPQIEGVGSLPAVLRAFQQTAGWSLRYSSGPEPAKPNDLTWSAPVSPGVGAAPGHLRLDPLGRETAPPYPAPADLATARSFASALGGLLNELMQTRYALWQREAELAAGVPLVPHADEEQHLAARLEAVLKGGAESVHCRAAALYLLDEATTQLKLRSSWGLPFDRLTEPARRLQGAVADLEALLGHAVVLSDTDVMRHWKVPEDFPAAVCVPVSTPTTLLGTLWVYSTEKRDFSDRETNLLEVVAGRLAADLEREMLMREGIDGAELKKQMAVAERLQRSQLPSISPLLDGWQLAGWTAQAGGVGGDFYDWFCLPDGLLATAVADAMGQGLEAALSATAVKAALRAHGQYHREAEQTLRRLNLTLWTGSAGDQYATLFYGLIETTTGRVCYSMAGHPSVVVIRPDGWDSLSRSSAPLGESPETDYEQFGYTLQPGEALVIFTDGVREARDRQGHLLTEAGVAEPLAGRLNLSAEGLANLAREQWQSHTALCARDDRTILVIKRTTA